VQRFKYAPNLTTVSLAWQAQVARCVAMPNDRFFEYARFSLSLSEGKTQVASGVRDVVAASKYRALLPPPPSRKVASISTSSIESTNNATRRSLFFTVRHKTRDPWFLGHATTLASDTSEEHPLDLQHLYEEEEIMRLEG
jgi:hypothetical protein